MSWRNDNYRHALASKGIKTTLNGIRKKANKKEIMNKSNIIDYFVDKWRYQKVVNLDLRGWSIEGVEDYLKDKGYKKSDFGRTYLFGKAFSKENSRTYGNIYLYEEYQTGEMLDVGGDFFTIKELKETLKKVLDSHWEEPLIIELGKAGLYKTEYGMDLSGEIDMSRSWVIHKGRIYDEYEYDELIR